MAANDTGAVMHAARERTEVPDRESQGVMHPAQPLSMGPGPTGLAMLAVVLAVAARKWRKRTPHRLPIEG